MTLILSIDPGLITGLSIGYYDLTDGYELDRAWTRDFDGLSDDLWNRDFPTGVLTIIERFVPQSGAEYTLKEDDLAGVEIIGMLRHVLDYTNNIFWRTRSQKSIAGSPEKSDQILKDHGLWQTGSMVDWHDGRDVNDSILHALGYLKDINHIPTLRKYFKS